MPSTDLSLSSTTQTHWKTEWVTKNLDRRAEQTLQMLEQDEVELVHAVTQKTDRYLKVKWRSDESRWEPDRLESDEEGDERGTVVESGEACEDAAGSILKEVDVKHENDRVGVPVDVADVDYNVNHITAQFIALHIHRGCICGDVDFANHIKYESFLYATILHQIANTSMFMFQAPPTEQRMLSRFSRVGSCGMSFWTILLNASKMEWS